MLEIFRKHGLIAFMVALGLVCLGQGIADWTAGRATALPAVAALMAAVVIEELQRRGMAPSVRALGAARWCCVLGAVGLMLRAA